MKQILPFPRSEMGGRKRITTKNPLMLELQSFFKKIIDSSANVPGIVRRMEKRLRSTNRVRQPVKLSTIISQLKPGNIPVIVGKVLDDERLLEFQKDLKIVALKWSHSVQRKVEANNGKFYTLDQFVAVCNGNTDILQFIQTDPGQRKSSKYWGLAPGEKGSTTFPRTTSKGKNKEKRLNKPKKYELKLEITN